MVDGPQVVVSVETAEAWTAQGPSAERALHFAQRVVQHCARENHRPLRVIVHECPSEHVGLGVGTQLGLAIADAVHRELEGRLVPAEQLAREVGRGDRSGIGIAGYEHGQLILDAGKAGPDFHPSQILGHFAIPETWRIVLMQPPQTQRWHGDAERRAFARTQEPELALQRTERLARLALLNVVPAARAADFPNFCSALTEFNRIAGEPFAEDQGGIYASPAISEVIQTLRGWGVTGVGQSSWGPTVFAFQPSPEAAASLVDRLEKSVQDLEAVRIATASPHGAKVS
jgi:beta-RFAP synthase